MCPVPKEVGDQSHERQNEGHHDNINCKTKDKLQDLLHQSVIYLSTML